MPTTSPIQDKTDIFNSLAQRRPPPDSLPTEWN